MIAYNLKDIVEVLFGNVNISEVYIGVNKVFPSSGPVPPTPYSGFCRLTLNNSSVVEIEGSGELTDTMTNLYRQQIVSAEIGTQCTSIGLRAFSNCLGLTSVTIPDSVTSIGEYAFYNCYRLPSINIPDGVTSIGRYAFDDCEALTSINIPDGVTTIAQNSFANCTGLTSITIPNGVTSIIASAFSGCTALTSITVEATTPPTLGTNAFDKTNNCPIYVPAESVEAYKTASRWSTYASRIQAIP